MRSQTRKLLLVLAIVSVIAVALAACAPQTSSSTESGSGAAGSAAAPVTQASADAGECAACHPEEAASMADASLTAAVHGTFACSECHADEDIGEIHASVAAPPDEDTLRALKKRGRTMGTSDFCLTCHGSLEELAKRTAEVTVVQDTTGAITNPHALPTGAKHVEAGVQECYNCHWLHRSSPSPTSNCNSCHHAGVYQCGTCHEIKER